MELKDGYKVTEIGVIPMDWEVELLKKHSKSSAFGPRFSGELYNSNGNVATLRTTDLDLNGNINYATMPTAQLYMKRGKIPYFLKRVRRILSLR